MFRKHNNFVLLSPETVVYSQERIHQKKAHVDKSAIAV
mgnify:CR=1 FL=1|jgi:hypothetical protein